MKTYKLEISGRVQGVFFRINAKRIADSLNIKGNVKNLDNGNVLVLSQCSKEKLNKFINELKKNPGLSKVNKINKEMIDREKFNGFRIEKEEGFIKDKQKAIENLRKKILKVKI